eukprot:gene15979-3355_t
MLPNQLGKGAAAIAAPCYTRETGCGGVQSLTPLNYDSGIDVNIAEERKNNEAEEEEEERLAFIPGASTTRVLPAKGLSVHSLIHAPWVPAGQPAPLVNLRDFPEYSNAKPLLYTVNAGDTLYIPAFWWHWVMSEGDPESIAVNYWTAKPHHLTFLPGCKNDQLSRRCGHEPKLLVGNAADWNATNNWDVDFLEEQWAWRVARDGHKSASARGSDRFGSCATADHLYPEMYSAGVLDVSKYHQRGAPPIPKSFGDIARGIQALLWITGGNVTSGLHFDQDYNSLTVLRGTKRVFLFDPADSPYLYTASKHV